MSPTDKKNKTKTGMQLLLPLFWFIDHLVKDGFACRQISGLLLRWWHFEDTAGACYGIKKNGDVKTIKER